MIDLLPGARCSFVVAGAVPTDGMAFGELAQPTHLVEALRTREWRELWCHQGQVKSTSPSNLDATFDNPGITTKPMRLFCAGSQMGRSSCRQVCIDGIHAGSFSYCGKCSGELTSFRRVILHSVRGNDLDTCHGSDLDQFVVASRIQRVPVVPDLDQHMVAPEGADQLFEFASRCSWPFLDQGLWHRSPSCPGQDHPWRRSRSPSKFAKCSHRDAGVAFGTS